MYLINILQKLKKPIFDYLVENNKHHRIYNDEVLTYPYVKVCIIDDNYRDRGYITSIGKYLNKFTILSPCDITHICEEYKSLLETNSGLFKIISGKEISNAYYYKNYYKSTGTLGHSCMRYKKCQMHNYFEVYEKCAKMLIMYPSRGKRIMGRAILWPFGDTYLMDRVYSVESYIEYQFYEYAKLNGFYILKENKYVSLPNSQNWLSPNDNYTDPIQVYYKVDLDQPVSALPYMDSVCYVSKDLKTFSTTPIFEKDQSGLKKYYAAHSVDGYRNIIRCQ